MDPFWDMIQTNCWFFTFSVLGDLRGNTVPSAFKRTATAAAHKPLCIWVALALLQLLADWLVEPCRGPGSSLVLGKQAAVCQGPLTGSEHSAGRVPVSLRPSSTGISWRERSFAFQSKSTCIFHFYLRSRRPFVLFLFSLSKKPIPQLNTDYNPVAKLY